MCMYACSSKVQFSWLVMRAEPAWKPRGKAVSCSCPEQVPAVSCVPLLRINSLGPRLRGLIPGSPGLCHCGLERYSDPALPALPKLCESMGVLPANGSHCPSISHLAAGPRAEVGGTSSFPAKANREVLREIGEQRHQGVLGVERAS